MSAGSLNAVSRRGVGHALIVGDAPLRTVVENGVGYRELDDEHVVVERRVDARDETWAARGLAYAVFGGTAPMVAVWLIGTTGSDIAFAWYLIGITAVSLTVALPMPEPSPDLAKLPTENGAQTARAARASP